MNKSKETDNGFTSIYPFVIGSVIILILWVISILILESIFGDVKNEKAAWFGDSFGGINSLFSGLAFAGIIYTILLQRKELQLQRQELKETRQELKRSADAQEKSEAAFTKQIELMNYTAQLNGMSSSLSYYIFEANSNLQTGRKRADYRELAKRKTEQMDEIITNLKHFGTY